ncbi:peptidoglycan-binding protein [Halobacteriales archaeon SW_7_68_16]|nr:MAG: peptidoglycan-binding protein [Halobacteriales archaeon SW_7_68_16]
MPERVEDPDEDDTPGPRTADGAVDFGWVMQVTFVATIVVGAPLVALLGAFVARPTWAGRAAFAVRVGAAVWIVTALVAYVYARRATTGSEGTDDRDAADVDIVDPEEPSVTDSSGDAEP